MRRSMSLRESATQTPSAPAAIPVGPRPTGIGVRKPVPTGLMRVTVPASPSVTQTASNPTATSNGPAFGSIRCTIRAVAGSRRESRPDDGATQTVRPCAATDPAPPDTTFATLRSPETLSYWGSMRLTVTDGLAAFEPTTQTAPGEAASPVGVPGTAIARTTVPVSRSIRATVRSSRFATHSEPEPDAIEPGRAPTFAT